MYNNINLDSQEDHSLQNINIRCGHYIIKEKENDDNNNNVYENNLMANQKTNMDI